MDYSPIQLAAGMGVAAGALLLYYLWQRHAASALPLPPSPKSYPLIGNLPCMPTTKEHLGFIEIGKQLGSKMFSLNILGTVVIVLNDLEDATNLLEKRSGIYSDRPQAPMVTDRSLMDWGNLITTLPYGNRWRKSRRIMHQWLHRQASVSFHSSQQQQARIHLQRLLNISDRLDSSEELEGEIYRSIADTIIHSIYGMRTKGPDDPIVLNMKNSVEHFGQALLTTNFLVNTFPALARVPDWFPCTEWKRIAKEWKKNKDNAVDTPYYWAKSQIALPQHEPSMTESILEQAQRMDLSPSEVDDYTKEITAVMFAAGTDTTSNTILVFFVAMILFPKTQQIAQAEIDAVIGSERLPEMEDRSRLPYVERLVQELLRWRPITPTGIPHACYQDDEYKGYRIPKGAIVIGNTWAMNHNPKVYKDPDTFDPDRFLDPSVQPSPSFGFGRRICPGLHFAQSSLFIFIASILATFNIEMAKDEHGNSVVPVAEGEHNLLFHPVPFKFKISPRSSAHEQLIRAED